MEYNFRDIETKWRQWWKDAGVYKVSNDLTTPKFYVLDMFPYPSGAGLHVGHPLGYIASDILARYKRLRGYNVLHPMGYDAFGLPAEQYALETGQHPAVTTEQNIARYREQLDNIGFCYDWTREVRTSDPKYYKWTQWIFIQLFESWYDRKTGRARPISELIEAFEKNGNEGFPAPGDLSLSFSKDAWKKMDVKSQRAILMNYRLAYLAYAEVWWCEALGTVLANDEVVNGVSERGGFPVVKKQMRQWFLRITEYAERLLGGLDGLNWSDAMKEMQRNWIGKSFGAEVKFELRDTDANIVVFTTRPDTIFGVDFMVLAPEHELVGRITGSDYQEKVAEYITYVKSRSERERISEVKQITGAFTGAYAVHPFTRKPIPVWISEYVLAGYGTGAIMAVPSGDERDFAFAKHFEIPITNIFGANYTGEAAYTEKGGTIEGSDFLNGLTIDKAAEAVIRALEDAGIGKKKINYRLRDAGFSRQRYWGEPFPVVYHDDVPYTIDEEGLSIEQTARVLPVELPHVESYKPGPEGQGPLANIDDWVTTSGGKRETNTMPGYAGSSWYFLRYMDPHNDEEFAGREATDYWQQVDVYVGGTEHAVGHLLYSRMWTKVLADLGHLSFDEPFKQLVNQGMIQGSSRGIYRVDILDADLKDNFPIFVSKNALTDLMEDENPGKVFQIIEENFPDHVRMKVNFVEEDGTKIWSSPDWTQSYLKVDVNLCDGVDLRIEDFKKWREEYKNAFFIKEKDGRFICDAVVEKMSKSKYNVVNPDDIVAQYGADTFRMYEMFLGPLDVSKPWDTQGIEGVYRFLKKLWRLYAGDNGWQVVEEQPTDEALRTIHKTIKKVGDDIERFSFNTSVSQFMICVNELSAMKCRSRDVLEALCVLLAPFAPHVAEELWQSCFKHESSVTQAIWPKYEERYLAETTVTYPVAVNGKTRTELQFAANASQSQIEATVMADETVQKWLEGKQPKKVIFVKGRMVNVVI